MRPSTSVLPLRIAITILLLVFSLSPVIQAQVLKFKTGNLGFQAGLEYVDAMRFPADNRFAYTASAGGFGVFDFDQATGILKLKYLQNMQHHGFSEMGGGNIVLSHDGKFAYATGFYNKNMYIFQRDAVTGALVYIGLAPNLIDQFSTSSVVTISPDDQFLYIGGSTLNIYKRNTTTGLLTHVAREYNGVGSGDIYISNNGTRMYLSSGYMRVFNRNVSTGQITLLEEHYEWANDIGSAGSIAVTPDEKYIFAGTGNKGIARFAISPATGGLSYLGNSNYPTGNIYHPLGPISVNTVEMNPAGTRLYASSYGALTSYAIDGAGGLTLLTKVDVTTSLNMPYYGLAVSRNAEYIFAFGSATRDTSVECFRENSSNQIESVRSHYFNESLNAGLHRISAEAISADDQFIFTSSAGDQCVASFHSGVSNSGVMSEINRLTFQQLGLPDGYSVNEIIASADGKNLYLRANRYNLPNACILLVIDVGADGTLSYQHQLASASLAWDMELIGDKFIYVANSDETITVYARALSGAISLINTIPVTEYGLTWTPYQLLATKDGSRLLVACHRNSYSSTQLWQYNVAAATGELQRTLTQSISLGSQMMLREEEGFLYTRSYYYVQAYPWNAQTGALGSPQVADYTGLSPVSSAEWSGMMPGGDLFFIANSNETLFYGFYDKGKMVYNHREQKAAVVSWSNGGGESGSERFLFPKTGNLVYAIRPSGNGIYVYEYRKSEFPPLPPTNVQATATGYGGINITWPANADNTVVKYEVYRETVGHTTPTQSTLKVGETTSTTFTDNSAVLNNGYYYWVKALTTTKTSNFSTISNGVSNVDFSPSTPASVSLQAGDRFIKLTWAANTEPDIKNYVVYRNTANTWAGAETLTTTTSILFIDEAVSYGQQYYYWIKAVDNNLNESAASVAVNGAPVNNPPAAPVGVSIVPGDRFLKLTWSANPEPDLKNYIIYRNTSNTLVGATERAVTSALTFTDELVNYGEQYYYWIKAIDHNLGQSTPSTVSGMPVDSPPAEPAGVAIVGGDRFLKVTWSANTEVDFKNYVLYKNTSNSFGTASKLTTTNALSYTDDAVDYGQTYFYWVKAVDTNLNESVQANSVSAAPVNLPPVTPVVSIGAGDRYLKINWSANSEPDFSHYVLYRNTANAFEGAVAITTTTAHSFTDDAVRYGVQYFYWVKSIDTNLAGSAESSMVAGMPIDSPPAPPGGVQLTSGDAFLKLEWKANLEPDFKNYTIYRNTTNVFAGATVQTTTTGPSFTDSEVSYGQIYYYWIKAVDTRLNESGSSPAVSGIPLDLRPAAPTGISIAAGDKFLRVSWAHPVSGAGVSFEIFRGEIAGVENSSLITTQTMLELIDQAVSYGKTYFYYVRAIDQNRKRSAFTEAISGTPLDFAPAVPTGLQAEAADSGIKISWNKNNEPDLKGYELFFSSINSPSTAKVIALIDKTETTFTYPSAGLQSYFWLKAFDTHDHYSDFSKEAFLMITSLQHEEIAHCRAYPNPAKDFVHVTVGEESTYAVFTVSGKLLMKGAINESDNLIDLRNLSPGAYVCKVSSLRASSIFRFIKL